MSPTIRSGRGRFTARPASAALPAIVTPAWIGGCIGKERTPTERDEVVVPPKRKKKETESMSRRSNADAANMDGLYAALKQFFTDNPGWE